VVNCPPIKAEYVGQWLEGFWDAFFVKGAVVQCFVVQRIFENFMMDKKRAENFEIVTS
jgi:hypothetical protein